LVRNFLSSNVSVKPLYYMYLRRHLIVVSIGLALYAIYWVSKKVQKRFKPYQVAGAVYFTLILLAKLKYNSSMKRACYRLQTDTFDNYYDGYTGLNRQLLPKYLPQSFQRGQKYLNLEGVKCKINSMDQDRCYGYFFSEYEHWSVYEHQVSCAKQHTAKLANYFKKMLNNPEEQVVSWKNPEHSENTYQMIGAYKPMESFYLKDIMTVVDANEIQNGDKELFIDFRGENSELGKVIPVARDRSKFDPKIKTRLKEESPDKPSVLRIFMDTTSKYRFYRKFKKTIKFLTNLKNNPSSNHRVVENTKHHNVAGFTDPNQLAFTHGISFS
jgi:hypothetical protein